MRRPTIRPGLDLAALAEAQGLVLPVVLNAHNPYRPGTAPYRSWNRGAALRHRGWPNGGWREWTSPHNRKESA